MDRQSVESKWRSRYELKRYRCQLLLYLAQGGCPRLGKGNQNINGPFAPLRAPLVLRDSQSALLRPARDWSGILLDFAMALPAQAPPASAL